ncbi:hypothetical protein Z043-103338 [Arapaima gigas]
MRIKEWVERMQQDLVKLAETASGVNNLVQTFSRHRNQYLVEPNNARQLVTSAATNIEMLLHKRSMALKTDAEQDAPPPRSGISTTLRALADKRPKGLFRTISLWCK